MTDITAGSMRRRIRDKLSLIIRCADATKLAAIHADEEVYCNDPDALEKQQAVAAECRRNAEYARELADILKDPVVSACGERT